MLEPWQGDTGTVSPWRSFESRFQGEDSDSNQHLFPWLGGLSNHGSQNPHHMKRGSMYETPGPKEGLGFLGAGGRKQVRKKRTGLLLRNLI